MKLESVTKEIERIRKNLADKEKKENLSEKVERSWWVYVILKKIERKKWPNRRTKKGSGQQED